MQGGYGHIQKEGDTRWLRAQSNSLGADIWHESWSMRIRKKKRKKGHQAGRNAQRRTEMHVNKCTEASSSSLFGNLKFHQLGLAVKRVARDEAGERVRASSCRARASSGWNCSWRGCEGSFPGKPLPDHLWRGLSNIAVCVRSQYLKCFSFMFLDKEGFATSLTTLKRFLSFRGLEAFLLCSNSIYSSSTWEWKAETRR